MNFDFRMLRAKIIEKYGSQQAFAKAYGISNNSFSRKMHNKTPFSSEDIIKMSEMLGIDKQRIGEYFFTKSV